MEVARRRWNRRVHDYYWWILFELSRPFPYLYELRLFELGDRNYIELVIPSNMYYTKTTRVETSPSFDQLAQSSWHVCWRQTNGFTVGRPYFFAATSLCWDLAWSLIQYEGNVKRKHALGIWTPLLRIGHGIFIRRIRRTKPFGWRDGCSGFITVYMKKTAISIACSI